MKAIVYEKYGPPDVLELEEVEKPIPKDNEVLVKVHAASVNDWDWGLLIGKPFVNRLVVSGLLKPKIKNKVIMLLIFSEILLSVINDPVCTDRAHHIQFTRAVHAGHFSPK